MGTESEIDIFERLESYSDKDFPAQFTSNITLVLEHAKDEIIEFLLNKPFSVLKRLRELVFLEFTEKLPEFQGRELYARKKLNLIAEDIYIFAFSGMHVEHLLMRR